MSASRRVAFWAAASIAMLALASFLLTLTRVPMVGAYWNRHILFLSLGGGALSIGYTSNQPPGFGRGIDGPHLGSRIGPTLWWFQRSFSFVNPTLTAVPEIDIPLWAPFTLATTIALATARAGRWHPRACPACGYDLTGLPTSQCPECGSVPSPNPVPSKT